MLTTSKILIIYSGFYIFVMSNPFPLLNIYTKNAVHFRSLFPAKKLNFNSLKFKCLQRE